MTETYLDPLGLAVLQCSKCRSRWIEICGYPETHLQCLVSSGKPPVFDSPIVAWLCPHLDCKRETPHTHPPGKYETLNEMRVRIQCQHCADYFRIGSK